MMDGLDDAALQRRMQAVLTAIRASDGSAPDLYPTTRLWVGPGGCPFHNGKVALRMWTILCLQLFDPRAAGNISIPETQGMRPTLNTLGSMIAY